LAFFSSPFFFIFFHFFLLVVMEKTVILSAVRTPVGAFSGALSAVSAPQLGAIAIKEAVQRSGVKPEHIDEVIMGNVLTAGLSQAPARQAAIHAGLPNTIPALTINKMCGSGLKAVMDADMSIRSGNSSVVVAGGQESMSNAPYLLPKARGGYRLGDGKVVDSMMFDGLTDAYKNYPMGEAAEVCAAKYNFTREAQDAYAIESYKRAQKAQADGVFDAEIVPVTVADRKGDVVVSKDEEPTKVAFEKVPGLKPVFKKDGTITAANASTIDDGAAALVVASESKAKELGATPIARIIAHASSAHEPEMFTTAPVGAIKKALERAGLTIDQIDLFEINEAFSVVPMAAEAELNIPHDKVNVHGGAVSLGHPIGASGARILTTLIHALKRQGKRYGLATLCIGGGEGSALIVEAL
jgi:acetyl-CoA C-acetyltransferase